jgi:REP element-mobilizing transposase RayT
MILNEFGQRVEMEWMKTPTIRPNVTLDEFVIMPDHMHAIVTIDWTHTGAYGHTPRHPTDPCTPTKSPFRSPSHTIGAIVRGFKSATTKTINQMRQSPGEPVWQRNYHEIIVRDQRALQNMREYTQQNPIKWEINHSATTGRNP